RSVSRTAAVRAVNWLTCRSRGRSGAVAVIDASRMWGGPEVRVRQRMRRPADDVVGAESMGKSGVPAAPGRGRRRGTGGSESADAGGLRTLRALRHVELDPLVLLQRAVAVCLDGRVVREQVRAAVLRGDESKALLGVEPLHGSCGHGVSPTK